MNSQILDLGSYSIKIYQSKTGHIEEILSIVGWPPYKNYGVTTEINIEHIFDIDTLISRNNPARPYKLKYPIEWKIIEDWQNFELLLDYCIKQEFLTPAQHSDDHLIVIIPPNYPLGDKKKLATLLKNKLSFVNIGFVNSATCIGFLFDQVTAIIVDFGYKGTNIVPIYEGYPMMNHFHHLEIGASFWDARMQRVLVESNINLPFSLKIQHKELLKSKIQSLARHSPIPKNSGFTLYSSNYFSSVPPLLKSYSPITNSKINKLDDEINLSERNQMKNHKLTTVLIEFLGKILDPNVMKLEEHSIVDVVQSIMKDVDKEIQKQLNSNILISGGLCNNNYFLHTLHNSFKPLGIKVGTYSEIIPVMGAIKLLNSNNENSYINFE